MNDEYTPEPIEEIAKRAGAYDSGIQILHRGSHAAIEIITENDRKRVLLNEKNLSKLIYQAQLILLEIRKTEVKE